MLRRCIISLILTLTALNGTAQDEVEYRMEVGAGIGAAFSLNDANSKAYGNTTWAGGAVMRFLLNPRMSIKTSLSYQPLKGNTAKTKDFLPANPEQPGNERLERELDGGITDLSATYELHFLPYGYTEGYQGFKRLVPYIQMGLGLTYSDAGEAFTVNIPVGFGLKYKLAPRLNLSLDWQMHFSLSDALDGIEAPKGIKTSEFRGKDHYAQTMITLTYNISPRCPTCNKD